MSRTTERSTDSDDPSARPADPPLLRLEGLRTQFNTPEGPVRAVDGVDLTVEANQTVGLVGESGSGKSTVARSILQVLPGNASIVGGRVSFRGEDLLELPSERLRRLRWAEISMVPQNAMSGFDPVYTVGDQIVQAIRVHREDVSKRAARDRARELFEQLGLEPERLDDYPHQYSGGMAQRAMIALAIALEPALVLADEPTTALDVVMQNKTLATLTDLVADTDAAMLLITHDMSVVSEVCDKIAVMYAGRIVEFGDAETVIREATHPYALGLRNAFPDVDDVDRQLVSIPGRPPNLVAPDPGCRFAPRCPFVEQRCREESPPLAPVPGGHAPPGHLAACFRADEAPLLRERAADRATWVGNATVGDREGTRPDGDATADTDGGTDTGADRPAGETAPADETGGDGHDGHVAGSDGGPS